MRILSRRLFLQVAAAVAVAAGATRTVVTAAPWPEFDPDFELEVTEFGYRVKLRKRSDATPPVPIGEGMRDFVLLAATGHYEAPDCVAVPDSPEIRRGNYGWYYKKWPHPVLPMQLTIGCKPLAKFPEELGPTHGAGRARGLFRFKARNRPDTSTTAVAGWRLVDVTDTHFVLECRGPRNIRPIIASAELPNGQTLEFKI